MRKPCAALERNAESIAFSDAGEAKFRHTRIHCEAAHHASVIKRRSSSVVHHASVIMRRSWPADLGPIAPRACERS
ncbi:MAG: hypothetical protein QM516_08285, partial [Limnohabitans sp.]|nr:hypothetical protein [Limnohabitans sp.]